MWKWQMDGGKEEESGWIGMGRGKENIVEWENIERKDEWGDGRWKRVE